MGFGGTAVVSQRAEVGIGAGDVAVDTVGDAAGRGAAGLDQVVACSQSSVAEAIAASGTVRNDAVAEGQGAV